MNQHSPWLSETVKIFRVYLIAAIATIPVGLIYAVFTIYVWNHWIVAIIAIGFGLFIAQIVWGKLERVHAPIQQQFEFTISRNRVRETQFLEPKVAVIGGRLCFYGERKYINKYINKPTDRFEKPDNINQTATDSHTSLTLILGSRKSLEQMELVPFKAATEAGIRMVMVGHIAVPGLDSSHRPTNKVNISLN